MKNWASAATLVMLSSFVVVNAADAQTRLELNAEDHACSWQDDQGRKGTEICHITAQGTIMGETIMVFHIGERKLSYMISDKEPPQLGYKKGEEWVTVWTGKLISDRYVNNTEVIKLSNGMTIKLFR